MGTDDLIKQLSDVIDEELDASFAKMDVTPNRCDALSFCCLK